MRGEDIIRIEHKLDALLWYMRKLTGEMPTQLQQPLPGMGGMTGNRCPITDTPVYLTVDPKTGDIVRKDGLSSGVIPPGRVSEISDSGIRPFMLRGSSDED
jgi:hypothetical protein